MTLGHPVLRTRRTLASWELHKPCHRQQLNKGNPSPGQGTGPSPSGWSPAELPQGRGESGPIWLPTLGPEPGPHRCGHSGAKTPLRPQEGLSAGEQPQENSGQNSGYSHGLQPRPTATALQPRPTATHTKCRPQSHPEACRWICVGDAINHGAPRPGPRPKAVYIQK